MLEFFKIANSDKLKKYLSLKKEFNKLAKLEFKKPLDGDYLPWHKVAGDTNCYTYALNIPDHGWAYPGELKKNFNKKSSLTKKDLNKSYIREALIKDGLKEVDIKDVSPKTHHVIAAVVAKEQDFHFYRWNKDGKWTHKKGHRIPQNTDEMGYEINDPEKATRGKYNEFIGYFAVPKEGIKYEVSQKMNKSYCQKIIANEKSRAPIS